MTGENDVHAIPQDLPCEFCNYNLRGLTPTGRCPECGSDISISLSAFQSRLNSGEKRLSFLQTADPAWLAKLMDGAALAVLGLGIKLVTVLLPDSYHAWKSPTRVIPLSLLATAWVVEALACWKLATPDPRELARKNYIRAWSVRILSAAYFAIPFVGTSMNDPPPIVPVIAIIAALIGAPITTFLVYFKLRHVARGLSRRLGMLSVVLCILAPFWLLLSFLPGGQSDDSLSMMIGISSILSGSPGVLRQFTRGFPNGSLFIWIGLLLPAMALVFDMWLFCGLHRFRTQHGATSTAIPQC